MSHAGKSKALDEALRDLNLRLQGKRDFEAGSPYNRKAAEKWRDGFRWALRSYVRDNPDDLKDWQRSLLRPRPRFSDFKRGRVLTPSTHGVSAAAALPLKRGA